MRNTLADRKEAYRRKIDAKKHRISSANIGISPDTKQLEELEEDILQKLKKTKYFIEKEHK
ncbi:hypothetical protein [Planococcus donghaensis]|uniref:Uncharacterized protein n=1 Tax=Planococcus donghaensis TaxID=414778 RepID=A0A1C7EFH5_9BACL|nr:hypothetical protein [Planococcus donghaensis]ANU22528.1 hypothetical protein BCM40_03795 [Planococcus donghaensis]